MGGDEDIRGRHVTLRAAGPEDRRMILGWLYRSDVTPSMLGPPLYPERPVPSPGEGGGDYEPHFFDGSAPELGRCYLILVGGEPVGQVGYNDIHEHGGRRRTELDLWMRSESCCGRGHGPDALEALCGHLHDRLGVAEFMVQPSARNPRAIRAYEKVGFRRLGLPIEVARALWGPNDNDDSVYMVLSLPTEDDGANRS
jgi:RimJ/RimL family protein N-acetyltransferase